jgi:hypothetical protein
MQRLSSRNVVGNTGRADHAAALKSAFRHAGIRETSRPLAGDVTDLARGSRYRAAGVFRVCRDWHTTHRHGKEGADYVGAIQTT